MYAATQKSRSFDKSLWAGRILSGISIAFLLFDGAIHMAKIEPVVQAFARLGFPVSLAVDLGILELACVALYSYPRTRVLGAIALTGYLGGAVATHVRAGSPFFSETLFPVYLGVMIWGGLFLRDRSIRSFVLSHSHP